MPQADSLLSASHFHVLCPFNSILRFAILSCFNPAFHFALSRPPQIIGNLSKDVFERRTSTGSEVFSLLICLDANKFVLLSFSSLIKTIYPRFSTEPLPNDAKSTLPVDVRRSKTLLLKLPNPINERAPSLGPRLSLFLEVSYSQLAPYP